MDLTSASPMQRLTLIILRLILASAIAVAVWGQFGSLTLEISSPVGYMGFTVCEFGIMLEYNSIGLDWNIRHDIRFTETVAEKDVFVFDRRWDRFFFDIVAIRKVSLPSIQVIYATIRYIGIILPTLLLNVAAHWRIRRKTSRAKSPIPLTNS